MYKVSWVTLDEVMGPMKNQVMDALHQNSEVQFLKRENQLKLQAQASEHSKLQPLFQVFGLVFVTLHISHSSLSSLHLPPAPFPHPHSPPVTPYPVQFEVAKFFTI